MDEILAKLYLFLDIAMKLGTWILLLVFSVSVWYIILSPIIWRIK